MAGKWLSKHGKPPRTACSACSLRRCWMPMGCAMTSAPSLCNSWTAGTSSWPSTKRAFSNEAGVGKQHYGPTGDLRNCQVGVFLSLVTKAGHCLIDREWYLPAAWTDDPARCQRVGVPATVPFRTKPQLAILMLQRL